MKKLWCWRCKMEVGMLNEEEYAKAFELYGKAFDMQEGTLKERHKELLDYYNNITGEIETVPNAIMHHRIAQYGPPCENCGKPYRTPKASFCAACGHKRSLKVIKADSKNIIFPRAIGYWKSERILNLPDPRDFIDYNITGDERKQLITYLDRGV